VKPFELLALRRKRAGLSQAQVARLSGLSRTNVSNVERGEARPELVRRVRLAIEALEKAPGALAGPESPAEAFARERREARSHRAAR